jgi:hypothetical protein
MREDVEFSLEKCNIFIVISSLLPSCQDFCELFYVLKPCSFKLCLFKKFMFCVG